MLLGAGPLGADACVRACVVELPAPKRKLSFEISGRGAWKSYSDSRLEPPRVTKEPEIATGYPGGKRVRAWPKTSPAAGARRVGTVEAGVT